MSDRHPLPGHADSGDANRRHQERRPPTPGWVKLLALAGVVIVVLVLTVVLLGGGAHGPGRHVQDGNAPVDAAVQPPHEGLG